MTESTIAGKLKVTVSTDDPIIEAALKFYALRNNQNVGEFCADAILCALEGCENQSDGYFSKMREEAAQ
jgi:hypothetical protein